MNTLNQTELGEIFGGETIPDIGNPTPFDQWAYDLFLSQLQKQAEEAERKAWQDLMASQAA